MADKARSISREDAYLIASQAAEAVSNDSTGSGGASTEIMTVKRRGSVQVVSTNDVVS